MPFNFNPNPDLDALAYFRNKGWQIGFSFEDVWRQEHQTAWTVAKASELDVLAAIRTEVDRALSDGLTFQEFRNTLTPTLQRLGWWGKQLRTDPLTGSTRLVQLGSPARLRTIYRTNLRTARAAGQARRIEQTTQTHPYLLYRLGPSHVHREQHVSWDGLMLPANDPWWRTHFPPNGWNCKCRVRQVSRAEARRSGRQLDAAPPLRRRRFVSKRTGVVNYVPEGIDPGWDYHPGTERLPKLRRALDAKRAALEADLGQPVPTFPLPDGLGSTPAGLG